MKLFISQPMNGKTNEDILNDRTNAINKVKKIDEMWKLLILLLRIILNQTLRT